MKTKIIIFLLLILLSLGGYGYYWYTGIVKTNNQAKKVLLRNNELKVEINSLNTLKESVLYEKSRCQNFISQEEGDFGDFEYCKNFISWVKKIDVN